MKSKVDATTTLGVHSFKRIQYLLSLGRDPATLSVWLYVRRTAQLILPLVEIII